jgi:hypothetical protein
VTTPEVKYIKRAKMTTVLVDEEISMLVSSDPSQGAVNRSLSGDAFEIQLQDGLDIPSDAINVNLKVEESTIWWVTDNVTTGINDKMFIFGDSNDVVPVPQLYVVTIPQGLYDLTGINNAVFSALESLGARQLDNIGNPVPLLSFKPDGPTQRVVMRLNYDNVTVDFTQTDTPRELMGFDSLVYGPEVGAPVNLLAPNVADFNQVNYYLIHSDMINKGIRINNNYSQTVAQVLINVAPGSQIVSTPFHPAKSNAQTLAGAKRTLMKFWLTDDKQRSINTNHEHWSARIVIDYQIPMTISGRSL